MANNLTNNLIISIFLLFFVLTFSQDLLIDDYHCWEPTAFTFFADTLASIGVRIHFVSEIGWSTLNDMDLLWIVSPGGWRVEHSDTSLFREIKDYYINGKPLLLTINYDHLGVNWLNNLIEYIFGYHPIKIYHTGYNHFPAAFYAYPSGNFPPLCDSFLINLSPGYIEIIDSCNSFPLLIKEDTIYATLTYYKIIDPCGPPLVVLLGNDVWENWHHKRSPWHLIESTIRYGKNLFLSLLGFPGYELSPCQVPSGYCIGDTCENCRIVINVSSKCFNPGDTVRIYGRNLWRVRKICLLVGDTILHECDTIFIPFHYAFDSTWLEFIMPDLPPGTYPIGLGRLGHKAITFDAGDIIVPCPMVAEIPECANPGDTVVVSGVNLIPDIVIQIDDTIIEPINYAFGYDTIEFVCPSLPPGDHEISFFWDTLEIFSGSILIPCPTASASFPECADPGDVITISGENLVEPIRIVVGDSVVSAVSYSDDRSKVSFRCPWLPRGRYQVTLSWHDMSVASGTIEIPCPHRCERFPNPITPNFDAINDFAQFEFDGIFVKPAQIHIFDIRGHEIRTIDVPAGLSAKQHARWDGTDDGGNPIPEGVYIYTIEVAGEVVCEGTVTVAR